MAKINCKVCGNPLDVEKDNTICVCGSCKRHQLVPATKDKARVDLLNSANEQRILCNFDEAINLYKTAIESYPNEADAYFGMALSKYGISFKYNSRLQTYTPIINRLSYTSFLRDEDYNDALRNSNFEACKLISSIGNAIQAVQDAMLKQVKNDRPYDVMICYADKDWHNKRTEESKIARTIFTKLSDAGLKVFYKHNEQLKHKLFINVEPVTFTALNTAKVMIVINSSKDNINLPLIKNEWIRFNKIKEEYKNRSVINVYSGMDVNDIPEEIRTDNPINFLEKDSMKTLMSLVAQKLGIIEQKETEKIEVATKINNNIKEATYALRTNQGYIANELIDEVLRLDSTNAHAYLLKSVIYQEKQDVEELKTLNKTIEDVYFVQAYKYADDATKKYIDEIIEAINNNIIEKENEKTYLFAIDLEKSKDFELALTQFERISEYKDSNTHIEKLSKIVREDEYIYAYKLTRAKKYYEAYKIYSAMPQYKDSAKKADEVYEMHCEKEYARAARLCKLSQFELAVEVYTSIIDYKDSKDLLSNAEKEAYKQKRIRIYNTAVIRREIDVVKDIHEIRQSIKLLETIADYKDVAEIIEKYKGYVCDYEKIVEQREEELKEKRAIRRRRAKIGTFISVPSILVPAAAILLTFFLIIPEVKQADVTAYIDQGNYEDAYKIVEENGYYGESLELRNMITGGQYLDLGDYENGIYYLSQAGVKVTANYDADGGKSEYESNVVFEPVKSDKFIESTAQKDGHNFSHWVLNNYNLSATNKEATLDFVASYEPIVYSLSYSLNGGTPIDSNNFYSEYTCYDTFTLPNLYKTGYTFNGWRDVSSLEPQVNFTVNEGTIGNKHFEAIFTANKYVVTLNANGGTVANDTINITYDKVLNLPTPEKTGYTFIGWVNESGETIYSGNFYTYDRDIVLTAQYRAINYSITYNLNGGSNAKENPSTFTVEDSFTLKNPTRTGYSFTGWTTSTNKTPTMNINVESGTHQNLTFTANWKANEYTVTIDLNGGKANKTTYTFTYDDVYQIEEPTRKGYVFDKFTWVNSNGVEEEFPSYGNKWNIPHNVRLIAQWNEATDTPFKTNIFIEKESVVDKEILEISDFELYKSFPDVGTTNDVITIDAPEMFGLSLDLNNSEVSITKSIDAEGTTEFNFYYRRRFVFINFEPNGGEAIEPLSFKYGTDIELPEATRGEDDVFGGWYVDEQLTTTFEEGKNNFTDEIVLYAYYSNETITSFFDYAYFGGDAYNKGNIAITGYKDIKVLKPITNNTLTLPKYINGAPVCAIYEDAFYEVNATYSNIEHIVLPESVTSIGAKSFYYNPYLISVTGGSNISSIPESAFEKCYLLTDLFDLSEVTEIDAHAFKNCTSLYNIDSEFLTHIGEGAFEGCSSLTSTPNLAYIESIGVDAFKNCTLLSEAIGLNDYSNVSGLFAGCENLTKIYFNLTENISYYYVHKLFETSDENNSNKFYSPSVSHSETYNNLYVPYSLESFYFYGDEVIIPSYFAENLLINTIEFDQDVSTIDVKDNSFSGCTYLTEINNTSDKIVYVGDFAFQYTSIEETPDLRNSTIESFAFAYNTSLKVINGFNTDKNNYISGSLFYGSYNIEEINVIIGDSYSSTTYSLLEHVFDGSVYDSSYYYNNSSYNYGTIYYPKSLKTINIDMNEYSYIPNYFLSGFSYIEEVNVIGLPTSIGSYAFNTLSSAVFDIDFSEVTTINNYAFRNCTYLTKVNAPKVTSIGTYAFQNCTNLTEFTSSDLLTSIGSYAFEYTSIEETPDLSNVTLNSYAFAYNSSLKVINGYNTYKNTSTSTNAFYGSYNIEEINVVIGSTYSSSTYNLLNYIFDSNSYSSSYYYSGSTNNGYTRYYPKSLKTINIDMNEYSYIPNYFLYGFTNIEEVNVIGSPTSIGSNAFNNLSKAEFNIDFSEVTTINTSAFSYCTYLTEVNAPEVTSIGGYAFQSCTNLTEVKAPKVSSIGTYAFESCTNLTEFTSSDLLTSIGTYAFAYTSIEETPDLNNASVGNYAFAYNTSLKVINGFNTAKFSNSSSGNNYIFYGSYNIEEINAVIGSSYSSTTYYLLQRVFDTSTYSSSSYYYSSSVNGYTRYYPTSLKTINIDMNEYSYIPYYFLNGFNYIEKVNVIGSPTSIGSYAFDNLLNAEFNIDFSEVTTINTYAFRNCTYLTEVNAPKVTSIGSYAFRNCTNLTEFTSSDLLTSIGTYAFAYTSIEETPDLSNVTVSSYAFAYNTSLKVINGYNTYRNTSTSTYAFLGSYNIEEINVVIGTTYSSSTYNLLNYIFDSSYSDINYYYSGSTNNSNTRYYPKSLKTINIDMNGYSYIPNYFLYGFTNIEEVSVIGSPTSIGNYAFYNLSNATFDIDMSEVTNIGTYAFAYTSIEETPDLTNATIGTYAFAYNTSLRVINGYNTYKNTSTSTYAFLGSYNIEEINVVIGTTYSSSTYNLLNYIFDSSYSDINYYYSGYTNNSNTRYYPRSLKTINIDMSGYSYIPNYFLYGFNNIEEVNVVGTPSSIGDYAFYNVSNATFDIDMSETSYIGDYAFYNCSSFILPDLSMVDSIGTYAFYGISPVSELYIPSSVSTIGVGAFGGIEMDRIAIESLINYSPSTLFASNVDDTTNYYFNSYFNIYIPYSLKSFEVISGEVLSKAFASFESLEEIIIGDDVTSVASDIIQNCTSLISFTSPYIVEYNVFDENLGATYSVISNGTYYFTHDASNKRFTSNNKSNSTTSNTIIRFNYDGTLSFSYSVSSESGFDKFTITHTSVTGSNVLVNAISGTNSGSQTINVLNGDTITLTYSKDGSQSSGSDCGIFTIDSMIADQLSGESTIKEITVTKETIIPEETFKDLKELERVNLPVVENILASAFENTSSLKCINSDTEVIFPDTLISIGENAFKNSGIESVMFDSSVTIETNAFDNCLSLVQVSFLKEGSTIDAKAFNGCTNIASISYAGTIEEWNSYGITVPETCIITCSDGVIQTQQEI